MDEDDNFQRWMLTWLTEIITLPYSLQTSPDIIKGDIASTERNAT
ncbi:MAG: hypothetical protein ACYCWK_09640 [Cuniculiplasma sp.]